MSSSGSAAPAPGGETRGDMVCRKNQRRVWHVAWGCIASFIVVIDVLGSKISCGSMSSSGGSAAPLGTMNLRLKMNNRSKVAKVLLGVLETVQGAYECVLNEEDDTYRSKVAQFLGKNLKHVEVQIMSFN